MMLAALMMSACASCGSLGLKCAEDMLVIQDPSEAFVVIVPPTGESIDPGTWDLQEYHVLPLMDEATARDVPVRLMADSRRSELFCSKECADKERERKNKEVVQRIRERKEDQLRDSLVMDSIIRGSIR